MVPAESVNLSRGGLKLYCQELPPAGTVVNLSLQLPRGNIEAAARIARIEIPKGEKQQPGIGLEFQDFAPGDEQRLIAYLRSLSPDS